MNKIAVIIANYNYANFIQDAINSCITQTRKPDLVIIVDDNSTDGSQKKIIELLNITNPPVIEHNLHIYQTIYENISFIFIPLQNTNGPSFVRNVAIDLTQSQMDLYQILDADDIMYPKKLEVLEAKITESPEIGVVYADYDIFNIHNGNIIREFKEPYSKRRLLQDCIIHSGSMIRKSALSAVRDQFGYYDVNMRTCEDYDLWLRISNRFTIAHIPQSLTLVRLHKDNSTFSVKNEVWQANWQRIREKLQQRGG